jgi:beta-lactamase regulating signal transducer with metallopeptidase domain
MTNLFALIVEAAVKGTFLMAAIALITFALRNATAAIRHSVLSFSIVAMIALPVITALAPPLRILRNPFPATEKSASAHLPAESRMLQSAPQNTDPGIVTAARDEPVLEQPINNAPQRLSLIEALAFTWLGGAIVGFITLVGGLLILRRMSKQSQPVSRDWDDALSQLKRELKIERDVRVLVSRSATMPATWGIKRPVIVLPSSANEWDAERRRVVLMHELAHVSRNDCLSQIGAQVMCAIYWFHPGAWYTARRLRAERELACDEAVVQSGVDRFDYATHLLTIATTFRSSAGSAVIGVAMARPSQLE